MGTSEGPVLGISEGMSEGAFDGVSKCTLNRLI